MKYIAATMLIFLFILSSCSIHSMETISKRTEIGNNQEWTYTGSTGPNNWGNLKEEYAMCSKGKEQSPINIVSKTQKSLPLGINYHTGKFKIEIKKTTIKLTPEDNSNTINIQGTNYELKQLHFHTPSEHLINGHQSDMEIHFVHEDRSHSFAVMGIFVDKGTQNKVFQKIVNTLKADKSLKENRTITLNIQSFIPVNSKKISYNGSLTTPPCTEGLKWIVFEKPIQFSNQQISFYRKYFYPTNRPVQPLNNRTLFESW
ncbi:carbonic anhydrase family protein [Bacillus sp. OAE603]|uniref:carbonic anhydrase n=1 Tax=Gottfriedia sp. OAE603 TaxID=2663872 RepID=UPI001788F52C